jgi:hypothetical protein
MMDFERARKLADAVLLEGYVLYPYRSSSTKNRFRWSFGVLAPRAWSENGGCEEWWMEAQCLVEPGALVEGKLRFLHARERRVEDASGRAVDRLDVGGRLFVPWDEGMSREVELGDLLGAGERIFPFDLPGSREAEDVRDAAGALVARVVRQTWPLCGVVRVRVDPVEAEKPLARLSLRVENETPWQDLDAPREAALRGALIAAHLVLGADRDAFLSLIDPPAWAAAAAQGCKNRRSWPVLAGPPGTRDLVLCAPIILYDHAQVAPESAGDLFDNTEIDEILSLRTRSLTEEEKREARATDARAAEVIDRVDSLDSAAIQRLHGVVRDLHAAEMVPRETAGAPGIRRGARVRLRPGGRRTDAQDLLYAGCTATVEAVLRDVDDRTYLAVTVDGDPAAELYRAHGRYHYFAPDEVELLAEAEDRP